MEKKRKFGKLVLKVLVSIALFYFIFKRIEFAIVIEKFSVLDLRFIPLVIGLLIANYIVSSLRWKSLLIFKNTENISVWYLTALYFKGSFFNNFMPTSIGGDVYKMFTLGKKMKNGSYAFASTFMERFTGVMILFLISLISFPVVLVNYVDLGKYGTQLNVILISLMMFGLFIAGLLVGIRVLDFISKKITKLRKIYEAITVYRDNPKVVIYALLTSVLVQVIAISTQYFIFIALGYDLPVFYSLMVFPVITLAGFFVPSINGIGVQDALYMSIFSYVGVPQEISVSASVLYHMSRLGVSLIGGILYAFGKEN